MKNLKIVSVFIAFFGAILMFTSLFFDWVVMLDPLTFQEEMINPWNLTIKRISVGILGIGGIFVTYYYSRTKFPKKNTERKFVLLQLVMGAVALFIAITGNIPEAYRATVSNGPGFTMAVIGSLINLIGCIILYFVIKKQESAQK